MRALRDDDHVSLAHRHLNEHPLSGMQFGRHRDEHILRRHLRLLLHRWLWYVTRSWHTVLQLLLLHLWLALESQAASAAGASARARSTECQGGALLCGGWLMTLLEQRSSNCVKQSLYLAHDLSHLELWP